MRVWIWWAACLTILAPSASRAEEAARFDPVPPLRLHHPGPNETNIEFRVSTARRGLAMLPRCLPLDLPTAGLNAGIGGIGGGETFSPRRKPLAERLAPSGVRVIPAKDLPHESEMAQERFARLFPKADPAPVTRMEHFDWFPHYDNVPVAWNSGWRAEVVGVEPIKPGEWKVTVRMKPRLYSTGFQTLIHDYVEETYRMHGESIELIGSDAETPKTEFQAFPVLIAGRSGLRPPPLRTPHLPA